MDEVPAEQYDFAVCLHTNICNTTVLSAHLVREGEVQAAGGQADDRARHGDARRRYHPRQLQATDRLAALSLPQASQSFSALQRHALIASNWGSAS